MADPKIAKKRWEEFYIGVYKVLELHVGSDEVTVAFFDSYTFDPTSSRATNYYCPYFFLQSTSAAAGQFLDTFSMDDEALFSTNNPRGRVGGDVVAPTPHRPGRADFPHPVPHERDSLAAA